MSLLGLELGEAGLSIVTKMGPKAGIIGMHIGADLPKLGEFTWKAAAATLPPFGSLIPQTAQIFGSQLGYSLHQEGIPEAYRASPNFLPSMYKFHVQF